MKRLESERVGSVVVPMEASACSYAGGIARGASGVAEADGRRDERGQV